MTKKILFIGHDASRTGAPRSLLNIATLLKKHGYDIMFLLGKGGPMMNEYEQTAPLLIWQQSTAHLSFLKRALNKLLSGKASYRKKILETVRKFKPDMIFNNTVVNGEIIDALGFLNVKIISRIPDLESVLRLYNTNHSSDITLKKSHHFVAVSNAVKKNLIGNHSIEPEKITVIHGYAKKMDIEKYLPNRLVARKWLNIPDNAFVTGACGSVILRKGFDFFIETAYQALLTDPDLYFVWVGGKMQSGQFIQAVLEAEKRKIAHRVFFIGEKENPFDYYAAMDLFFMCSREDPFPLTMLEAAQFDKPVLGFKETGGVEELLEQGGGFLADYANCTQAAQFIHRLKADKNLYNSSADKIKCATDIYSEKHTEEKLLQLIEKILK
jgi:glycosyltransferase involved in cell wall biosynthesis